MKFPGLMQVLLVLILSACSAARTPSTPTPALELTPFIPPTPEAAETAYPVPAAPTPTAETAPTPYPAPGETPAAETYEEAIYIREPGPGSVVTSPVQVAGMADPAFEQTLVIRIVTAEGEEIALQPATIQAEIGQRGPYGVEVSFDIPFEQQGFIQVYQESPRDGQIEHLHSVGVTLSPTGPAAIRTLEPHQERIILFSPAAGAVLQGGTVHVEGFALASFEQHLLVELQDENGEVIGSSPVTVQAPDWGLPGPFRVDLTYRTSREGPGRLVVRDPSVAFQGDVHISSVAVEIRP
jgi:hypothetical protein